MDDFFDLIPEDKKQDLLETLQEIDNTTNECPHANTYIEECSKICANCGFVQYEEQEEYVASEYIPKIEDILIKAKVPQELHPIIEKNYAIVTDGKKRLQNKNAYAAICTSFIYRKMGTPINYEDLLKMFGTTKKKYTRCFKEYFHKKPEDARLVITPYISINQCCISLGIQEHADKIQALLRGIEKRSAELYRSRPRIVAAAAIFFYITLHQDLKKKLGFTKATFASTMKLAEITISKLVNIIANSLC